MAASQADVLMKLVIIGDSSVGKSSLLLRYVDGSFNKDEISTIGVEFSLKMIDVDDKRVHLQIWDTAGQERFRAVTSSYYRGAHAILIVYDVTNEESFDNLKYWMKETDLFAGDNVQLHVVGNKTDLVDEREVSLEVATAFCDKLHLPHTEASALEGNNVADLFQGIAEKYVKAKYDGKIKDTKPTSAGPSVTIGSKPVPPPQQNCCGGRR